MKRVAYSKSALKVLRRMPVDQARRITSKVDQYASDPQSMRNNVNALTGSPYVRLRAGDWRIIIDDGGNVLSVLKIGPRGNVYE